MKTIVEEVKEIKTRNRIMKVIESIMESKGLMKVESDSFEEFNNYINQNPRQDSKRLVKVMNLKGEVLVLKPDITTNLMKQTIPRLVNNQSIEMYYLDKVYRYGDDGSIVSTRQFGVELIGKEDTSSDIELLRLITQILDTFNIQYYIELGNQEWINILLSEFTLSKDQINEVKQAIIIKNKSLIKKLLKGKNENYVELLISNIEYQNKLDVYQQLINKNNLNPELSNVLLQMRKIVEVLDNKNIEIDLSLINEFDYYNGPIFKVYINDYKKNVLRGGRYDYLTKEYGLLTPALGFSLDLDKLIMEVSNNEQGN